jgi:hypothetical protein
MGDENKLTYFRRPLLSKDALMFIHQVIRYAGFLSDSTSTNLFLCEPCTSSHPRIDRGERA